MSHAALAENEIDHPDALVRPATNGSGRIGKVEEAFGAASRHRARAPYDLLQ